MISLQNFNTEVNLYCFLITKWFQLFANSVIVIYIDIIIFASSEK